MISLVVNIEIAVGIPIKETCLFTIVNDYEHFSKEEYQEDDKGSQNDECEI